MAVKRPVFPPSVQRRHPKNGPGFRSIRRVHKEIPLIRKQQIRVNGRIRAREVRVIVASTNEQLGVLKLQDALRKAQSLGLDLVEVAPNAKPPVCRIVDFGKFRYELAKQEKERKHSTSKLKEVKFRVNIDAHDYLTKIRRAEGFLDKGNKLKVQLQFRGRENAHRDLGQIVMQRVREDLATMAVVEMEPRLVGRSINMTLSPLPANKRKRRFSVAGDDQDHDDHDHDDDHDDHEEDHDDHDGHEGHDDEEHDAAEKGEVKAEE